MNYPVIIVVTYNRPACLERLLASLKNAVYPDSTVKLIISIDGNCDPSTTNYASKFKWDFGDKEVINRTEHLGLKHHILTCGNMVENYHSIIILEDDLMVSPHYYEFAFKAQEFYSKFSEISGVSLYQYDITENGFYPFTPIDDAFSTYFMQLPSSWGQAWTDKQWEKFRLWFDSRESALTQPNLPLYVSQWPDTSWKKIFTSYLMETNRYFVFPRRSFTTNFGDEGTHTDRRGLFQVPLAGKMLDEPFAPFSKEAAFYDTWFELEPDCLKNILPDISHKDFTLDLYGTKHPESINSEFVFTTRKSSDIEKSYGLEMIPAVMNIIHNIPGDMICFSKKEFVSDESPEKHLLHYNTAAIHKDIYHNIIEKSAKEIATVIFKEMKNDLEFQQKYPRFLIISLIRDFASSDQIISVSRHIEYPNFKHAVINFFDHSMCVDAKSKLDFEKANINNPVMVINEIIKNASPELILIVPGIIQIDANTLSVAQEIFNKYPEIQWVNGFNPDVTNESSARWNRDWIRSLSGECANSSLSFQNVIFNRQLWDQLNLKMIQNSSLNEYSIWTQFAHHTDMYTIDKSFVKQDVPSGLKQNYNQSFSRYSATKHSQPISHRFLSGLLYPSYRHNIPFLKTWYSQLNHIPPLLHWDEKLNTCYFLW